MRWAVLLAIGCTSAPGLDGSIALDAGTIPEVDGGRMPIDPVLYPSDRTHSPITPDLAASLRAIAGPDAAEDVFSKIGDSITVDPRFLHCFSGTNIDLDGRPLDGMLDFFHGAIDPFDRESQCATTGWSASAALAGDPSPLTRELDAVSPRYGVVMYGTNDVGFRDIEAYARDMLDIADQLIARGAIPLLSSIPPRDDDPAADARIPRFNLAVRAIAAGRGVPFVDLHRELEALPDHGLGGDGVHPYAYSGGACVLDAAGLTAGVNVRNLLTLEMLDRAFRAINGRALDDDAPRLAGAGTSEDPFEIDLFPFAFLGDTRRGVRERAQYSGCGATQDESGPEEIYRFALDAPAHVAITVLSSRGADLDVHLLDSSASEAGCIARDDRTVEVDLEAGTYYVVADTFVGSAELAGEYLILAERL